MASEPAFRERNESYDLVVCGGGMAGFCAAVAAARQGVRTCLVHDRPVLGGNSSSEVRVTIHGAAAKHWYGRETGIISEALIEERARNHEGINENGWTNSVWDMVLYDMAVQEPSLTLMLNTQVISVAMVSPQQIKAVRAVTGNAETFALLSAKQFIDCTGDGTVAFLAGCHYRQGCESKDEFGEIHAPERASTDLMGSSIHFKSRNMGRPVPFQAPSWAVKYEDASFFYDQGRNPSDVSGGYWWIEIGVPWDTIHQNEEIRHELTRHALGVWDWIKNRDSRLREKAANWALDWVGQVPGKRESRRFSGLVLMTENDIQDDRVFDDEIAYGGWRIDLHTAGGLLAKSSERVCAGKYTPVDEYAKTSSVRPYGIPLRALISRDVDNLMMAGRNISVTRAALGSTRVMGTTALMGQAAGVAVAYALEKGLSLAEMAEQGASAIQQALLRQGCFLPHYRNQDSADFARTASIQSSSDAKLGGVGPADRWVHGGLDRRIDKPRPAGKDLLTSKMGQWIAVDGSRIKNLQLCLSNRGTAPAEVPVVLQKVNDIWDYRMNTGEVLAQGQVMVLPGERHWVTWEINVTPGEQGYVRLDAGPSPEVEWAVSNAIIPGCLACREYLPHKMTRYDGCVSFSFKVDPPQAAFAARNIVSGITRPFETTNLWRSDPALPLPQWIELSWPTAQTVGTIEITFAGHLMKEYHSEPAFFRDPQTVKDYTLSVRADETAPWREVVTVEGNYQKRRVHSLPGVEKAMAIRLTVLATNGDPGIAVYEIRCYSEEAFV